VEERALGERPHIFVATHHKGGTVWMMTTFIRIAEANGWSFVQLNEGAPGWTLRADKGLWFEDIRGPGPGARLCFTIITRISPT